MSKGAGVDATHVEQIASEFEAQMRRRGVAPVMYGKQPIRIMEGLHHEIRPLVEKGFAVTFILQVLRRVGVSCHENTLRLYLRINMPEHYQQHYSQRGRRPGRDKLNKLETEKVQLANNSANDIQKVNTESASSHQTSIPSQNKYNQPKSTDANAHVKNDPSRFFGSNYPELLKIMHDNQRGGK